MKNKRKVHLYDICPNTLCGRNRWGKNLMTPTLLMAKSFKEVTCKCCMRSEEYKQYLAGKFKEKPDKKDQTQGYLDIILGK